MHLLKLLAIQLALAALLSDNAEGFLRIRRRRCGAVNCSVNNWSAWTQCSTQCGTGTVTRTRTVIKAESCGGSKCGALSETKACTSYAANRDCKVSNWGSWGSCSVNCAVGKSYRSRTVTQSQNCKGAACSSLEDTKTCGSANGGCQHNCKNGACSCNAGYLLNSDKLTCRPQDCGQPSVKYCPSGTKLGTCQYPTFTCDSGTTYTKTCSVQCPNGYELKNGPSSLTCQSSGAWTTYQSSYCSRINKPPSKITLSNSNVNENVGIGSVVGTFTTTDPNPKDTHTYQLEDNASGRFKVSGSSLLVSASVDYETLPNSFQIKVRSTDNKGLYLEARFTVSVTNVNEIPTAVTLSNFYVNENSGKGTVVGSFRTNDPDSGQTHTYSLLSNAGGRFSVDGNKLQVAVDNTRCLAEGGIQCLLNFEETKSYTVKIRSQDDGSPPRHKDVDFTIQLRDVNDQPRAIQLSGYKMKEDAAVGTSIGVLSASDEDPTQSLTYTLSDDAGGRFAVQSGNKLTRKVASGIDYETTKSYQITSVATDNGKPAKSISKQFTIDIVNANESPVTITFSSSGGQLSFSDNSPSVNENSVKGTTVGTLSAFDADATQKLTFRLDDSAGGRFALKTSLLSCTSVNVNNLKTKCTVPVVVDGVLNHEVDALHTIIVRATDEDKLFKTERYSIKIVDVNDRPRDITFSGGAQPSVKENLNGATLGTFKTTDDDHPMHIHTYSFSNSAGGLFILKGNALMTSTNANLNYEGQSQYTVVVRSTDSGSPLLYVEKTFTVQVVDVNEAPTAVILKNDKIAENSPEDSVVGTLSTVDPDNRNTVRQSFTYTLLESAQRRFKLDNSVVKVAPSNAGCLAFGGDQCKINYEVAKSHKLVVQTTDNGNPPLVKNFTVTVYVTDVNDQPRNLAIDGFSLKENAPANSVVGTLSALDEDTGQILSYQLIDSDNGQFRLIGNQLLKAKPTNYETKTSHSVVVAVSDSGNPIKSLAKVLTIEVLNVNEPPLTVRFTDAGGQSNFQDDLPQVEKNSAPKTVVGTVEARDEDTGELKFNLDDNADGLFEVATGKGVVCSSTNSIPRVYTVCTALVKVADTTILEGSEKHHIIVRVTDEGGLFRAVRFIVAVVDVKEEPTDLLSSAHMVGGNLGIVEIVGIVGGVIALVVLIAFFICWVKKRQKKYDIQNPSIGIPNPNYIPMEENPRDTSRAFNNRSTASSGSANYNMHAN